MRKILLALSVLVLSAATLPAQERGRVLNGFEFIPSRIVEDPFAITYFGTSTGGGVAFDLKTPFVDVNGDTLGTLTGDVARLPRSPAPLLASLQGQKRRAASGTV